MTDLVVFSIGGRGTAWRCGRRAYLEMFLGLVSAKFEDACPRTTEFRVVYTPLGLLTMWPQLKTRGPGLTRENEENRLVIEVNNSAFRVSSSTAGLFPLHSPGTTDRSRRGPSEDLGRSCVGALGVRRAGERDGGRERTRPMRPMLYWKGSVR